MRECGRRLGKGGRSIRLPIYCPRESDADVRWRTSHSTRATPHFSGLVCALYDQLTHGLQTTQAEFAENVPPHRSGTKKEQGYQNEKQKQVENKTNRKQNKQKTK